MLLIHGHQYPVKRDPSLLIKADENHEADFIIFGHTHIPYNKEHQGVILFNPGALLENSYGVLQIQNNEFTFRHLTLD